MDTPKLNRIKIVLAEKGKNNKWLCQTLNYHRTTVSRWVTNKQQPSIHAFQQIAKALQVEVATLFEPSSSGTTKP